MLGALLVHCSTHVPDAMHVRTDGRTNADLLVTREIKSCSVTRANTDSQRWIETPDGLAKCPRCYPTSAKEAS